jgi:ABC-type transport system involved in multi-copper enzyme maturation permease subunit
MSASGNGRDTAERVLLIAGQTLRAAARQRAVAVLAVLAVAFVAGAVGLTALNFGETELKFLSDVGFGAMMIFGSALTIVATAQLFFAELEHRSLHTLLAKPVRRAEFIAGQYLGVLALVAALCAGLTILLGAILWSRERALSASLGAAVHVVDYGALAAIGFALWLKLAVLSAWTLLLASFARTQLFAITLGFLVLAICQLQFLAQAAVERAGTAPARVAGRLLAGVFPDFRIFDLAEVTGRGVAPVGAHLGGIALYGVAYAAVIGALAAWSFSQREL